MNSTPVIRIIAQARMGSSRLPGKIAARLGSSTLLGQVVRGLRLAAAQFTPPGEVWVATTTNPGDDVTEQQCLDGALAQGRAHPWSRRALALTV